VSLAWNLTSSWEGIRTVLVSGWKMVHGALPYARRGCVSDLGLLVYTRCGWGRALRARRLCLRTTAGRSLVGTREKPKMLERVGPNLLGVRLFRGWETGTAGATKGCAGTSGETTYG